MFKYAIKYRRSTSWYFNELHVSLLRTVDKWRVWATVRAQGNRCQRLFEVVKNAVDAVRESWVNFALKKKSYSLENEDISSRKERRKKSKQSVSDCSIMARCSTELSLYPA